MNTGMILHTILGLLLLLIPAGALYLLGLKEVRSDIKMLQTFAVSVARMVVQLLVLCLLVWGLMRVDCTYLPACFDRLSI